MICVVWNGVATKCRDRSKRAVLLCNCRCMEQPRMFIAREMEPIAREMEPLPKNPNNEVCWGKHNFESGISSNNSGSSCSNLNSGAVGSNNRNLGAVSSTKNGSGGESRNNSILLGSHSRLPLLQFGRARPLCSKDLLSRRFEVRWFSLREKSTPGSGNVDPLSGGDIYLVPDLIELAHGEVRPPNIRRAAPTESDEDLDGLLSSLHISDMGALAREVEDRALAN